MSKMKKYQNLLLYSLIATISLGFITILFVPAAGQYMERIREKESGVDYLISGRGCNDYANASDEELKEKVDQELDCCISNRKFKKKVLKDLERGLKKMDYYNSKEESFFLQDSYVDLKLDKKWNENCVKIQKKVLLILEDS